MSLCLVDKHFSIKVDRNNSRTRACMQPGPKGDFAPNNFQGGKGTLHRRIMDFPAQDDPPLSGRVEQGQDFPRASPVEKLREFLSAPARLLSKRDTPGSLLLFPAHPLRFHSPFLCDLALRHASRLRPFSGGCFIFWPFQTPLSGPRQLSPRGDTSSKISNRRRVSEIRASLYRCLGMLGPLSKLQVSWIRLRRPIACEYGSPVAALLILSRLCSVNRGGPLVGGKLNFNYCTWGRGWTDQRLLDSS